LRAEGFSCSLDISKLQFLNKKRYKKILAVFFLQFLVFKTLDPDPDSLKMLYSDPYPDSINPDPQL
jgi:hypothetical protein